MKKFLLYLKTGLLLNCGVAAQSESIEPDPFSDRTYFETNLSYIVNNFSSLQLEPGFTTESVHLSHIGVRFVLYGHKFTRNLSMQASYMRPVSWVYYKNVNGDHFSHAVFTNFAGITFKSQFAIQKKFSAHIEAGPGLITRAGFSSNGITVVKDENYWSLDAGVGLQYRYNQKISFNAGVNWSPSITKRKQPSTTYISGGVVFHVRRPPENIIARNNRSGYFFSQNLLQVGYTSNSLGYGINDAFSNKLLPIFWGGRAQVKDGFLVQYLRNIYHGRKVFSLDFGTTVGYWRSKELNEAFYTFSIFPLARFTVLHSRKTDLYFNYSVAGLSFISKRRIDSAAIGKHFTFQDLMGMGIYTGTKRKINMELRIGHFSNGNLFPKNEGVMLPLTFCTGYSF